MIVQTIQLAERYDSRMATPIMAIVTYVERLPRTAYEMWPPSSWPTGNRLSDVASNPNQAANPIGCRTSVWVSGSGPQKTHDASFSRSGSPRNKPASGCSGTTCDNEMPMKSAGTATRNPAMGPAMPMSNNQRL